MGFGAEGLLTLGTLWLARQAWRKGPFPGMGQACALLLVLAGGWLVGTWCARPADGVSHLARALVLASAFLAVLLADRSADRPRYLFVWVPAFALTGMLLVSATHLAFWWLAWVAWGAATLGLVGFPRASRPFRLLLACEIGASAFAGLAVLLIGGVSGQWQFEAVADVWSLKQGLPGSALLSGVFLVLAFALKLGVFPLHQWRIDGWSQAALPVWALLLSGQLAVLGGALFRVWTVLLGHDMLELKLIPLWMGGAALSMLTGALLALVQRNLVRLVISVVIAQTGIWLLGLIASQSPHTFYAGLTSSWFQLVVLLVAQAAVLAVFVTVMRETGSQELYGLDGLAWRSPLMAAVLTWGLLAWLGSPPSAGFVARMELFSVVSRGGDGWLAVVGGLTQLLLAALLVQLLRRVYGQRPSDETPWRVPEAGVQIVMAGSVVLLTGLFLAPGWFLTWIGSAVTLF